MGDSVVITGMGMVTPLGATSHETMVAWQGNRPMQTKCLPELAGTMLADTPVAKTAEYDAADRLGGRKMLKFMSEGAVLGCVAAHEAAEQAMIAKRFLPERIGLYAATGLAAADIMQVKSMLESSIDEEGAFCCRRLGQDGLAQTNPLLSFRILANMPACLVSILEHIKGPNGIFTPWESQAALALQEAWLAVSCGEVDCALVGGADTPAHPATCVYLRQDQWLQAKEIPANAGAYLVLERSNTAMRDKVHVYGTLEDITVSPATQDAVDPLSIRMGRTFATAPFILTALGCHDSKLHTHMISSDGWKVAIRIGGRP